MYLLISDETNLEKKENSFFVYGGVFLKIDKLIELDEGIENIRNKYGYNNFDPLKFNSASRPNNISTKEFAEVKNELIDLCISKNCKFIAFVILHNIAKNKGKDFTIKSGINHVTGRFNEYLRENSDYGICVMDRISGHKEYKIMENLHIYGLDFSDGKKIKLDRIKLFTSSSIKASNISSIVDVILGSFRYCINNPVNIEAAKVMMKKIFNLIWYIKKEGRIEVLNKGLILRPQTIKSLEYQNLYNKLIDNINNLLED